MADEDQIRTLTHAAFRFIVDVDGKPQAAFTECALPPIEWEVEEIKEGGLNTYVHQLPGRRKAGKVTLKNGVGKSELLDWYIKAMSEEFIRKPVTITLLGVDRSTVMSLTMEEAYPVKWSGPQLKSDANTIAIQSLDLACGEITIKTGE
jgi:phage tail-like protein